MDRLDKILEDELYREYIDRTGKWEKDRIFCRHTFQHFVDVARIAYILMLESEDIERFMVENDLNLRLAREIIYTAAFLHDIGRWQEYETGEDHAKASSRLAEEFLNKAGFSLKEIGIITKGIKEHRRLPEEKSLLGKYLNLADLFSRQCRRCEAAGECYKADRMETSHRQIIY